MYDNNVIHKAQHTLQTAQSLCRARANTSGHVGHAHH